MTDASAHQSGLVSLGTVREDDAPLHLGFRSVLGRGLRTGLLRRLWSGMNELVLPTLILLLLLPITL